MRIVSILSMAAMMFGGAALIDYPALADTKQKEKCEYERKVERDGDVKVESECSRESDRRAEPPTVIAPQPPVVYSQPPTVVVPPQSNPGTTVIVPQK